MALLAAVALYDLPQRRHAILRNFPILGHFRFLLESVGPELRKYIVTGNDEERPFSRDQRRFGARGPDGQFSLERFLEQVSQHPVKAVEIKLSQGAKPGMGGLLPAAKITEEIAAIRGIPLGQDCHSPSGHTAFRDADELLDFVELLADRSGLPVGIKSAVGQMPFWIELAELMSRTGRGVDFITVDGGEGGTGAAPLVYTDHVALPFKIGFSRVYKTFCEAGIQDWVVFIGSGKLGFPAQAMLAFGLRCDLINVAREAMLAIGCIQAQRCHTDHCPTGVATQNKWLMRGLDPALKSARLANDVVDLRKELAQLSRSMGVPHPALVGLDQLAILDDRFRAIPAREVFGYEPGWELPSATDRAEAARLMERPTAHAA